MPSLPALRASVEAADLRMPLLGLVAWLAGVAASVLGPGPAAVLVAVGAVPALVAMRRSPGLVRVTAAAVLVAAAVVACAGVRQAVAADGPVADLAREQAAVEVVGRTTSDPRPVAGRFAERVAVRLEVREVGGRGERHRLRSPVLVLGGPAWGRVRLGAEVATRGVLVPPEGGAGAPDVSAVLVDAADPRLRSPPDPWWRGSDAVRASIRDAVDHRPADQRALVPALVDGDDAGLDPDLAADFRTTGLTHLTAVSGTNLTLLVGFLLVVARWCRVRGRGLALVAGVGIVGFLLLARTEPSVLRAAVMGGVGLLALGADGRRHGARALGVAVVVLLLVQPALALSAGFALSVLATAGIVVLAPGWRDALARWLPSWLAAAVAVPLAAQVACTPVVAGLSGQVSLVAVGANLLAAPAVAPATVLGLAAGLVGLVWDPPARLLGTLAGWCVGWVVAVARHGSDLPVASVPWAAGALSLAVLTALCGLLVVGLPWLLRRPLRALLATALLVVVTTVRLPTPGWPGDDWVLAMCDVGQGDALVIRAGPGAGVLVDAGPDPQAVDGCLSRLGVERLPLVVLTHFHADHVDGLRGALDGRTVGEVWTTSLLDPPDAVHDVGVLAATARAPARLPPTGAEVTVGQMTLRPVWPPAGPVRAGPGDGSTANDASVVLLVRVRGVDLLLTGDVEPPGQAQLARSLGGLDVDVLKVPHHGSRYQDMPWLASVRAEVALVSVGADNDYGHPAPDTVEALRHAGAEVFRTDEDGDVLVVPAGDGVTVRTRGS